MTKVNSKFAFSATEIAKSISDTRIHNFGTAIVQKRTPGCFTYEFGKGSLAVEAVVSFLLTNAASPVAMQKNVDSLSAILMDGAALRKVWDKLFPSMTQSLTPEQHLFSVNDIQAAFANQLGAKAISGVTAVLTELTVEALSGTRFVSRTEGYSIQEVRESRFPDEDDLARECVRAELITALKAEPLRLKFDAKKFSPQFLFDEFQRACNRLGLVVAKMGYNYDALNDAMYVIYTALNDRGSLSNRLPAEVINSGEFAELSSNLTFVIAAFAAAVKKPRDGAWNLRSNMGKVIQIFNLSDRYDIVTMATAVAHMRYTSVVDPRSNLLGGVLSYSAPIKHRTDVALFHSQSAAVPLMQAVRLERYSESFSALVSPTQGWDIMDTAHDIVESIVSVGRVRETDDMPRSTLWVLGTLSANDLIHIAVHYADKVYLPRLSSDKSVSLDTRLIFEKDLKGKRLFADSIPFEGKIYTQDARTLLLGCDSFDSELSFDMTGQFMPDFVWNTLMVDQPSDIQWDFNGGRDVAVQIGESKINCSLLMTDLTRHIERDEARMIRQPFTAGVIDAAFQAIHDAKDWVLAQPSSANNPAIRERLLAQVGHQLHSMYEKMSSSDMFQDVLETVIRRMAKSVPPDLRDETYMSLEQANYRLQVSTAIVGYIYERLQMMSADSGDDTDLSIHKRNLAIWSETDFFNRMIGAARAHRVQI